MARFFFHRLDGGFDPDTEGTECTDLHAARIEAILYAAGTVRDRPDYVWRGQELRIEVTDEQGALVADVLIKCTDATSPNAVDRQLKR